VIRRSASDKRRLTQQQQHRVAERVKHGARRKSRDVLRRSLDDGAQDVEENGDEQELEPAKDVGNLPRGGLGGGADD
jgi:hypothetical protein